MSFCRIYILLLTLCFLSGPAWALRIVSLLPSNTEILEALGAKDEIVGVTVFDVNQASRTLVGDFINPNIEKIVALKPDLIAGGSWRSSRAVARLKSMGFRVVEIVNPHSMNEIYASVNTLADAIGRPDNAGPVIREMKRRLEGVRGRAQRLPRRYRAFIEIDAGPWTPGGKDFITESFAAAGLDSIFADLPTPSGRVSNEAIVARRPELIIAFDAKASEIAARPGWSTIPAVRQNWIIDDLPPHLLTHPGPVLLDGLELLESKLEALVAHAQ